jgi:hypothetical protein
MRGIAGVGLPQDRGPWRRRYRRAGPRAGLWTVPELWKTHRPRFPQLVGRRTERAAHNGPQGIIVYSILKNPGPATIARTRQEADSIR